MNVNDPSRISVYSPRTTLIPQRLFNFVAQITQCHGKSRESILELAKYNDGMDAEDYAHPRYIASLLRVGDLLDIDDGRFCPTLLHNIGDVPQSSLDHQAKHASIRHLFINSEVIEIRAECEEYGAYHAQQGWFNYIQEEFDYQKRVWNEIVPDNTYRALPTIGMLSCDIKDYIAINGKVPKLTLDPNRVYSYITGSQIYSEKYPFVRELIQNSIDATIYKVWDDLSFDINVSENDNDYLREEFNRRLEAYDINISFEERDEAGNKRSYFSVQDFGTGMTLKDIEKILVVGSESTDFRRTLNQTMPEWAKPSGYFGIGLQTVFNLCKKVIIKTKAFENPCFEIVVKNDCLIDFYDIAIKNVDDSRFQGTIITAIFDEADFPSNNIGGVSYKVLRQGFDPLNYSSANLFRANLIHTLTEDFEHSKINLKFEGKEFVSEISKARRSHPKSNGLNITDYELGMDIDLTIDVEINKYIGITYKYKGVEFDLPKPVYGLTGEIDIFKNNAGYWLTIDRKKGRTDREDELFEIHKKIIDKHSNYLRDNTIDKKQADFLIYAYTGNSISDDWKDFEIEGIPVSGFISGEKELLCANTRYSYFNDDEIISIDSLQINLLAEIALRQNVSLEITLESEKRKGKSKENDSYFYKIKFINNNLSRFNCDVNVLKHGMISERSFSWGRLCVPCYSEDFYDISMLKTELPNNIIYSSPLNKWSKKFILSPKLAPGKKDIDVDNDLNMVLDFYETNSLLQIDKGAFKEKYRMIWEALDMI